MYKLCFKGSITILVVLLFISSGISSVIEFDNEVELKSHGKDNRVTFKDKNIISFEFSGANVYWDEVYNKYGGDDCGYSVTQTSDDGYFICAHAYNPSSEEHNLWAIKTDSDGDINWNYVAGGSDVLFSYEGWPTNDGGYITVSTRYSGVVYQRDVWLLKLNSNGGESWSNNIKISGKQYGCSVDQTSDNGYIVTGYEEKLTGVDCILVKSSSSGSKQWDTQFSEGTAFMGKSVRATSNGYIIVGNSGSMSNFGMDMDIILLKTNTNGAEQWRKSFGSSSGFDYASSVRQTDDNGYIIVGFTKSYGSGGYDIWLIKTDSSGNTEWSETYGGSNDEIGNSVEQTDDGGYIIVGSKKTSESDYSDLWVIKTDSDGDMEWELTYGDSDNEEGQSICITDDDGYAATGINDDDVWLVKINVNNPPNEPFNPNPEDGAIDVDVDADLSWTGGDPDGDDVTYDVYFGDTNPPPKVVSNQSGTTYSPNTMNSHTKYYWQIVAWDDQGAQTKGEVWEFTTENNPPNAPSNPSPANGSVDVDINVILSWTCSDPDGDDVTYDVYFGDTNPPPKLVNNQSVTTYSPENVEYSTTYYWRIVAWDEYGSSNSGPVWEFTTEVGNQPPYEPSDPYPEDGATDVPVNTVLSWTGGDPDGDDVTYDVYFGDTNPPPKVVSNQSGTTYSPDMNYDNTYYWKIVSWDEYGLSTSGSVWEFITEFNPDNDPPDNPDNPVPENGATDVDVNIDLYVDVSDPEEDSMDVSFFDASDDSLIGTDYDVPSGGTATVSWTGLEYNTSYSWYTIADDGKNSTPSDMWSFKTISLPPLEPDLSCSGPLNWVDVPPGDDRTGSFTIENIGDPGSLLDWEIVDYPDWGSSWNFTPKSGLDLTPEDGQITVEVKVTAPNVKNTRYTGSIMIRNSENHDDSCSVSVSLITPKNKPFLHNFPIISWFLDHFPNAFKVLRIVLGQ